VVELAKRDAVGNYRFAMWMPIREDVRGIKEYTMT
jgi:hypothetical protein